MGQRRFDRIGWAMSQEGLTSPQKFVLVVLADAANEDQGTCWLKHGTIAGRTSLGVTTVRDAIRYLVENEYLRLGARFDRAGRQTSNLYQLGCYENVAEGVGSRHLPIDDESSEGVASRQGEVSGADRSIVNRPEGTGLQTQTQMSQTSSSSSRARRASRNQRRQPDDTSGLQGDTTVLDWSDPRHAAPADEMTAADLADFWSKSWEKRGVIWGVGNTVVKRTTQGRPIRGRDIVRHQIRVWLERGVPPRVIRSMIELFVADPYFADSNNRWKRFIANAEDLQARVQRQQPKVYGEAELVHFTPEEREELLREAAEVD